MVLWTVQEKGAGAHPETAEGLGGSNIKVESQSEKAADRTAYLAAQVLYLRGCADGAFCVICISIQSLGSS